MGATKIVFSGEINAETADSLLGRVQSAGDGPIELYFDSNGGEVKASEMLAYAMNDYAGQLTIIAYDALMSSALIFFLMYKGERRVLPGTIGMAHRPLASLRVMGHSGVGHYEDSVIESLEDSYKRHYEVLEKAGLTLRQLEAYKRREDVMIRDEQLITMINK